jgi:hypothetical protein
MPATIEYDETNRDFSLAMDILREFHRKFGTTKFRVNKYYANGLATAKQTENVQLLGSSAAISAKQNSTRSLVI